MCAVNPLLFVARTVEIAEGGKPKSGQCGYFYFVCFQIHESVVFTGKMTTLFSWCCFGFVTGSSHVHAKQNCPHFATQIAGDYGTVGLCVATDDLSLAPALPTVCEGVLGKQARLIPKRQRACKSDFTGCCHCCV